MGPKKDLNKDPQTRAGNAQKIPDGEWVEGLLKDAWFGSSSPMEIERSVCYGFGQPHRIFRVLF